MNGKLQFINNIQLLKVNQKKRQKKNILILLNNLSFMELRFIHRVKLKNIRSLPNKVILGVNYEGIHLFRSKNKEFLSSHPFTEICSWASNSGTFAFEFGNLHDAQKYTFLTDHSSYIASTIQMYIDILVEMLKNGDEDAFEESDGTSLSSGK